ncbi:hypothetical protein C7445_101142 [Alicyclobacillus sacchari]|uniref:Uncharacterized protein n=1 Tax=Alicyclobacillus sacchari TaxID=392010 RepID=A0A4R8LWH2_9BACL|nr:hypothetical protein C7445_101142 [Alicyclobacillus sacchari]
MDSTFLPILISGACARNCLAHAFFVIVCRIWTSSTRCAIFSDQRRCRISIESAFEMR